MKFHYNWFFIIFYLVYQQNKRIGETKKKVEQMDSYFKVYYNLKKLCRILIDNLTLFKNINFIYITHNMAQKSVEKTYISQVQK